METLIKKYENSYNGIRVVEINKLIDDLVSGKMR